MEAMGSPYLFNRHDYFHRIQTIKAKIIRKVRLVRDLHATSGSADCFKCVMEIGTFETSVTLGISY